MRVVVDLTRCEGHGQCAFLAPDAFRMRGDEALMYETEPDDAQRERILRAEAACPVHAIMADGCGVTVTGMEGDGSGRLRRAYLSDGTTIDIDVAVAALGAIRNVEWLLGSGLAAGVWGVACDAGCHVSDANGLVTDDVFVAGDVARTPHPAYEYQFLAVEHWGNAVTQAGVAAHNMINPAADRWPHVPNPVFWSAQFGTNIKSVGAPTFADQVVIAQGAIAARRFVAAYGYRGRVTAAVGFDQGKWLERYQKMIDAW